MAAGSSLRPFRVFLLSFSFLLAAASKRRPTSRLVDETCEVTSIVIWCVTNCFSHPFLLIHSAQKQALHKECSDGLWPC